MEIIKGGSNVAAQFEAAGIEIAKPAAAPAAETKEEPAATAAQPAKAAETPPAHPDDIEGEDGLTPRQKREWTEAMRRTVGKKHRAQREAEALATSEYNRAQLAEERAAQLARENEELKAKAAPAAPVKTPAEEDPEPVYKEGDDSTAYWDKWKAWNRREAIREFRAETEKEREQTALQEAGRAAEARIKRANELVPDFAEVTKAANLQFGEAVCDYLWRSELFPEVAYHLATHPDEAERIRGLPNGMALVAIGKLEAKLSPFAPANGTGGTKEPTSPKPPETESGKSAGPSKRPAAPVIAPIPTGTGTQADAAPSTQKEHATAFGKSQGVNLYARKRH